MHQYPRSSLQLSKKPQLVHFPFLFFNHKFPRILLFLSSTLGEKNMRAVSLCCLATVSLAGIVSWSPVTSTAPTAPTWPSAWSSSFTEVSYYGGEVRQTNGSAFFDYPNGHLNWTRYNAIGDPVCASAFYMPADTTCSHIIDSGNMYLYTPEEDQCCLCCTAAQECEVFPPTVLQYYTYVTETSYMGQSVYEWTFTSGGLEATYLETTETDPVDRKWVAMFSPYFNYTSMWDFTSEVETSAFQLPAACPGSDLCTGVCVFVRNGGPPLKSTGKGSIQPFPFY